jgi:hypothetical protein
MRHIKIKGMPLGWKHAMPELRGYVRMPYYIVRNDEESIELAIRKRRKAWLAILLCALGIGIGIGMRLVASNPRIIAAAQSALMALGIAIWSVLRDIAQACADFMHYVTHTRSG